MNKRQKKKRAKKLYRQATKHLTKADWKQIGDGIAKAWSKYIDYIRCETTHWAHIIDALTIKDGDNNDKC